MKIESDFWCHLLKCKVKAIGEVERKVMIKVKAYNIEERKKVRLRKKVKVLS